MSADSFRMLCIVSRSAGGRWRNWSKRKPEGNPFFAIQFFTALAEEELLAFDPVSAAWQWEIKRIRAKNYVTCPDLWGRH
jgi:hypothetical protein